MSKQIQNFFKTNISQDWSIGTGNFYVETKPTITDGWLVISPNNSGIREIIKYTSTGTDGNGDYVVVSERGVGGTTEQTHTQGEPIRMNITAEYWQDMNDTIDALSNKVNTLTAFWLNDELYDVYDDFDTYGTGESPSSSLWGTAISDTGDATANVKTILTEASTQTGNDTNELNMKITPDNFDGGSNTTMTLTTTSFDTNKHAFGTFAFGGGQGIRAVAITMTVGAGNGTDGWSDTTLPNIIVSNDDIIDHNSLSNSILVIAKGSNTYDIYINSKKVFSDVSKPNGLQLKFYHKNQSDAGSGIGTYLKVGKLLQSKGSV